MVSNMSKQLHRIASAGVRAMISEFEKVSVEFKKETGLDFESFDGDDVEFITKVVSLEFDLFNGNLIREEFFKRVAKLNRH